MPKWFYFSRPGNMACHDLTSSNKPPAAFRSLLGLGLNFCVIPETTTNRIRESLERFRRDIYLRVFFAGSDDLTPTKLFVRSDWEPPPEAIPAELRVRIKIFQKAIKRLFRVKRCASNLIPHQRQVLTSLRESSTLLVVRTDKNLGPAVIDRSAYIRHAFADHLSDRKTYLSLTKQEARSKMDDLAENLELFIEKYNDNGELSDRHAKFLEDSLTLVEDPFPRLYLLFKIHKSPLKTRPIVSVSGSTLHALGRWVDCQLQPLMKTLPSFIASSWELKNSLEKLPSLPSHARLFTCDAVGMYTNIDTDHALAVIADFLDNHPLAVGLPANALVSALELVMRCNIFQFGDTYWHQLCGTAMGTPPAVVYATLYYAIHELAMPARFRLCLAIYKRYIDDGIGIWLSTDLLLWSEFKNWIGSFGTLKWTFTEPSLQVDYLDITIRIDPEGDIKTTLFEKPLNLYLYLPSHSAHPPGVLTGLIYGMIRRVYRLTSCPDDCFAYLQRFYRRLRERGYSPETLVPLFTSGLANRNKPARKKTSASNTKDTLFLHVPFHPANPSSQDLQSCFRDLLLHPRGGTPLPEMSTPHLGNECGLKRMILAYHRPRNLANFLCPRKLEHTIGPPVSAYLRRDSEGHCACI
jgi:hypothetical protein